MRTAHWGAGSAGAAVETGGSGGGAGAGRAREHVAPGAGADGLGSTSSDSVGRKVTGPATTGSLHLLDTPVGVDDSRPGTQPAQGPKTPLSPTARTIAVNVNGNMTIWRAGGRAGIEDRRAGGGARRFTASATSGIDAQARISIAAGHATHVVLDVVGDDS